MGITPFQAFIIGMAVSGITFAIYGHFWMQATIKKIHRAAAMALFLRDALVEPTKEKEEVNEK